MGYPRASYTQSNQSVNPYGGLDTLSVEQDVYRSLAVDSFGESLEQLSLQQDHEFNNQCFSDLDFPALSRHQMSMNPKHELSMNPKHEAYTSQSVNPFEVEAEVCVPSAEPQTPPGGYLDPNCHFFINTPPQQALNQMHDLLKSKSVDVELWMPCFKLKCQAYRDCASVEFYVRVFAATEEQRKEHGRLYAVEFQRRFGDGVAFHQLYNEFKQDYLASSSAPSPKNAKGSNSLQCPSLDLPDMQCCKIQQANVLKSLLSMCESDCVDVKAQAIIALAEMTVNANCELKTAMFECGVVKVFIRSLCCKYSDVHRCAVTGLANMISCRRNYTLCDGLLSNGEALDSISELIRTGCPQVVRECARSFAFLADTMPDKVRNDDCVKNCVQALLSSEDSQAREMAQHVQSTLAAL